MSLHPGAWTAWLAAVAVFAAAVSNPYYVTLALGAVLLVHLAAPPDTSPAGRAPRTFLLVGLGLLALRLVLVALVDAPGQTTLLTLPRLELPRLAGGVVLGGAVTGEVLAQSAAEGLRLVLVLVAFGVFNARVDLAAAIRLVPPAFRDAGLVVSIAVAFVPGLLRTVRDVRDAQRLRGDGGLRALAPSLAVPVLGLALERAFLLAESMDARGYGRGAAPPRARALGTAGLVGLLGSIPVWMTGRAGVASLLAVAGGTALVVALRASSRSLPTTRLDPPPWHRADVATAGLALAVVGLVLAAGDVGYTAYPAVRAPGFSWGPALVALLLAGPAVADLAGRRHAHTSTAAEVPA